MPPGAGCFQDFRPWPVGPTLYANEQFGSIVFVDGETTQYRLSTWLPEARLLLGSRPARAGMGAVKTKMTMTLIKSSAGRGHSSPWSCPAHWKHPPKRHRRSVSANTDQSRHPPEKAREKAANSWTSNNRQMAIPSSFLVLFSLPRADTRGAVRKTSSSSSGESRTSN